MNGGEQWQYIWIISPEYLHNIHFSFFIFLSTQRKLILWEIHLIKQHCLVVKQYYCNFVLVKVYYGYKTNRRIFLCERFKRQQLASSQHHLRQIILFPHFHSETDGLWWNCGTVRSWQGQPLSPAQFILASLSPLLEFANFDIDVQYLQYTLQVLLIEHNYKHEFKQLNTVSSPDIRTNVY